MTSPVPPLPSFAGDVVRRPPSGSNLAYEIRRHQYATTSVPREQMSPGAIVTARDDEDIFKAIRYAREHRLAIALRSGGHSYGGCSSTTSENLQLDLSKYRDFVFDPAANQVTMSAGLRMAEINAHLARLRRPDDPDDRAFFPHGHCAAVGLGGHLQTGGYTIFERAFGMFIDHVAKFRILLADCDPGRAVWVHRPDPARPDAENDELWFCVLGGSPGNFGVVTHVTANLLWDKSFPQSRSYRRAYLYRDLKGLSTSTALGKKLYRHLLEKFAKYNDLQDLPGDFSLTVAIAGASNGGLLGSLLSRDHLFDLGYHVRTRNLLDQLPHPAILVVDGMWCNSSGNPADYDETVKAFFADLADVPEDCKRLELGTMFDPSTHTPMSRMWEDYTFMGDRFYKLPFMARNYGGTATDLSTRGFAEHVSETVDEVMAPGNSGVSVMHIYQAFGGARSQAVRNAQTNPTALGNRRHMQAHCVIEGFYSTHDLAGRPWSHPKAFLSTWMRKMQSTLIGGPDAKFSPLDRRYMYGPFDGDSGSGHVNLDAVHEHFYDSPEVYQRVLAFKRRIDPDDVFTPNLFCVGASERRPGQRLAERAALVTATQSPPSGSNPLRMAAHLLATGLYGMATLFSLTLAAAASVWRRVR